MNGSAAWLRAFYCISLLAGRAPSAVIILSSAGRRLSLSPTRPRGPEVRLQLALCHRDRHRDLVPHSETVSRLARGIIRNQDHLTLRGPRGGSGIRHAVRATQPLSYSPAIPRVPRYRRIPLADSRARSQGSLPKSGMIRGEVGRRRELGNSMRIAYTVCIPLRSRDQSRSLRS